MKPNQPPPQAPAKHLARILFPYRQLQTPRDPETSGTTYTILPVEVQVSIKDRLRLLFSGRCEIMIKTAISPSGAPSNTLSSFSVLPPHSWQADPPPARYSAVMASEQGGVPLASPVNPPTRRPE